MTPLPTGTGYPAAAIIELPRSRRASAEIPGRRSWYQGQRPPYSLVLQIMSPPQACKGGHKEVVCLYFCMFIEEAKSCAPRHGDID